MNTKNLILFLLACFLWPEAKSFAAGGSALSRYEESLENRVNPVIQKFDRDGFAVIKAAGISRSAPMAMTPFEMKDVSIESSAGEPAIRHVSVLVFTSLATVPADLESGIKRICSGSDERVPVTLKVQPFKITVPAKSGWSSVTSLPSLVFGLGSVALILLVVATTLLSVIGMRIAKSLALTGGPRSSGEMSVAHNPTAAKTTTTVDLSGSSSAADAISLIPVDSLIAVLSDCYWSECDGYASFVWKRISFTSRKAILDKARWLEDYFSYLAGFPEEDLNCLSDPYYLAPLPFSRNDNRAITGLVKQYPVLITRLSALRTRALPLTLKERVEIQRLAAAQRGMPAPRFAPLPPSPARTLKARLVSYSAPTAAEEVELLGMKDLEVDVIEQVPSLIWLLRLPKTEAQEILNRFSAKDLASIWVGAKEPLKRLQKLLPEKKLELLNNFLKQISPDRRSPALLRLHALTMNALRRSDGKNPEDTSSHDVDFDQAA